MLASLRYLPSFCGRWELELYPNWNNIVVLPVHPQGVVGPWKASQITAAAQWKDVTKTFTQIGLPFTMIDTVLYDAGTVTKTSGKAMTATVTGGGTPTLGTEETVKAITLDGAGKAVALIDVLTNVVVAAPTATVALQADQVLTCLEGSLEECLMSITTFQLRFEVFEDLRRMYSEQPLIIPTNILHYSRFSGQPGNNTENTPFHATLSQSLENCDSVFILVPFNTTQTTCYYQPYLTSMRLSLGEFGIHPSRYVETFDNPHFVAIVLDSLNLETSEITAMNEDVARSITAPRSSFKWNGGAVEADWVFTEGDYSNFFMGFSLSQVGFQSGTVSSPNTNIPFIFDARTANPPAQTTRPPNIKIDTSIICMFLLDCAIMIQVVPNSDIPVVKLTNKSIV
jgi:hypothetical protein